MLRAAMGLLVILLGIFASSAVADDFTAVKNGSWKDPATWGRNGQPADQELPGMVAGRYDMVFVPAGLVVDYAGPITPPVKSAAGIADPSKADDEGIDNILVWGRVRGRSSRTPIGLKVAGKIEVDSAGEVGGGPGSKSSNPVTIDAGDTVTVKGRVTGEYGKVTIRSGSDILIGPRGAGGGAGPRIDVTKSSAELRSTGGRVVVAAGDSVRARNDVAVRAGAHKAVQVDGTILSEKGDIHVNGGSPSEKNPGNVEIGAGGALLAPGGEVVIKADTLRVRGRIEAHTVQKICNVLIIETGGSIKAAKSTKNKIAEKKKAEPRGGSNTPAEEGGKSKSGTGDNGAWDFTLAGGTLFAGTEEVRLVGGVDSVLDLTGNPAGTPVIFSPGPIEIYVDHILTDAGVFLEDLCGPGPVMTGPSMPDVDVACSSYGDTVAYPGYESGATFHVANMGFVPGMFELTVEDSLGWHPVGPWIVNLAATDSADTFIHWRFPVPPWAEPDEDTNRLTMTARSMADPDRWYQEEIRIPVWGEGELRDVDVARWDMTPAWAGQPLSIAHWIANNGRILDDYFVTVGDREGWPLLPYNPDLVVPPQAAALFMSQWEVPPGTPDGFANEIYITVASVATPGVASTDTVPVFVGEASGVASQARPASIRHGCRPNPFNPRVVISFELATADAEVTVTVHDLAGRRVATLLDGRLAGNVGSVTWRGVDDAGRAVASGMYVYRISTAGRVATGKMLLER